MDADEQLSIIHQVAGILDAMKKAGVPPTNRPGMATTIACRLAGKQQRRRSAASLDDIEEPRDKGQGPGQSDVDDLLAHLPEPLRQMATERLEGRTLREIAKRHGWPLGKVERLLQALRNALLRWLDDPPL